MSLLRNSEYLISDGGSNQEECFYLGLPCLLMRKASERSEGLGANVLLSGYDRKLVHHFMKHYPDYRRPPLELPESPTDIIVDTLLREGLAG